MDYAQIVYCRSWGVKDTIQFTAIADTNSAKSGARYYWFKNDTLITDSSLLTFSSNGDTSTFISNGLLQDNDVIRVMLISSYMCVTSDTALDSMRLNTFNPLPQPSATINFQTPNLCK